MSPTSYDVMPRWQHTGRSETARIRSTRSTPVDESWDSSRDVLSLRSFPSTSILRPSVSYGSTLCKCLPHERHRSLFTVNRKFTSANIVGRLEEIPSIKVCYNAENIWECKLPREVTGLEKRVDFKDLPNVGTALRVLKRGTYWYKQLSKGRKHNESAFCRRIARLLAGLPSSDGKESKALIKSLPISLAAVQRLRSSLATVDGMLMQAVMAFPGEAEFQDWKRIDQIQRSLIANLLVDYFRDNDPNRVSTFEKVKRVRKDIKREVFNPRGSTRNVDIPRELSAMRVMCSLIRSNGTPLSHWQGMVLSQTRASGVPPRSVYDKTLAKTKAILTEPSDRTLYKRLAQPIAAAVDHLYGELLTRIGGEEKRDAFFESVIKESKVSLSDSGEFFTPTEQGGKLEAARKVLRAHPEIPEINLHTGKLSGRILTDKDPMGDRLFHWACGMFTDRSQVYDKNNMSCRISLVAELGKYRTITVSVLQHALLLHPFSHLGLKILEAFPSSQSGIGAANHAWNFFKRLSHRNPSADFIFKDDIETVVFSTDWSQATDFGDRYVSGAILNRLMNLLGVPKWYRETVVFALTGPRQVETLDRDRCPIERFFTTRGILMGDPVTKVVLHLFHLVGRRITEDLLFQIFKEKVLDNSSDEEE